MTSTDASHLEVASYWGNMVCKDEMGMNVDI